MVLSAYLAFGGAGAILISLLVRCWAVDARVTRVLMLFGDETGVDTVAYIGSVDTIADSFGWAVAADDDDDVDIRSNSIIASWIAFSSWEFSFRPLKQFQENKIFTNAS